MGVVRIDDELLKKLKEAMKKEENRFRYGSLATFVNSIIYDKLVSEKDKGGKKNAK